MPDPRITADEDELLRSAAEAKPLKEPEQSLHRHVHDVVGRFLAGGEMHDMRDAIQRGRHDLAVGDRSARDFQALLGIQQSVVAQRAHAGAGETPVLQQPGNEGPADFSRSSCYE